jgi:hypothetical protein
MQAGGRLSVTGRRGRSSGDIKALVAMARKRSDSTKAFCHVQAETAHPHANLSEDVTVCRPPCFGRLASKACTHRYPFKFKFVLVMTGCWTARAHGK